MESIWNEHGNLRQNGWALSQTNSIWNPWNPHGIGMDSTWNPPGTWGHSKDLCEWGRQDERLHLLLLLGSSSGSSQIMIKPSKNKCKCSFLEGLVTWWGTQFVLKTNAYFWGL